MDPQNANAFRLRGSIFTLRKKYDLAIDDFNIAIRLEPREASSFYMRGMTYLGKGQHDRAIEDFDEASRLNPSNSQYRKSRDLAHDFKRLGR